MRVVGRGRTAVSSESQRVAVRAGAQTAVRLLSGRGCGNAGRATPGTVLASRRSAIEGNCRRRIPTLRAEGAPVCAFSGRCRRSSKARQATEGRSPKSSCSLEMGGLSSPVRRLSQGEGGEIGAVCLAVEAVLLADGGRSIAFRITRTIAVRRSAVTISCEVAAGLPASAVSGRRGGRARAVSCSEAASSTAPIAITGASVDGPGRCPVGRPVRGGMATAMPAVITVPSKKGGASRLRLVLNGAAVSTIGAPSRVAESGSYKRVAPSKSHKTGRPVGRHLASRLTALPIVRCSLRQEAIAAVTGVCRAQARMCQVACRH